MSRSARDQLSILVVRYPIWPGDTLSHAAMKEIADKGFAVRDSEGNWIPTAAGLKAAEAEAGKEPKP